MNFELTKENINLLQTAIKAKNQKVVGSISTEMHPADVAELFDHLDIEEAKYFFETLEKERAADVIIELEEDVRERFLEYLTSEQIAKVVIDNVDTDDAADVIGELSESKQEEVLSHVGDAQQASNIVALLSYDTDSAGGLMGKELVYANINWTVSKSIREMRKQAEYMQNVYAIYVVNDDHQLVGRLPVKQLLFSASTVKTKIEDLYIDKVRSISADTERADVAKVMEKYDLVTLPVVDDQKKLIGRISIDDVVDVIKEEAEKDYQLASGISENVEASDSIWILSRARLPWLLIGLIGGVFGAQIISVYEHQLQINPQLAFFIPLIAAMGGNVGVQSSAIVVQGLANKSLQLGSIFSRLVKELIVAIVNGLICSVVLMAFNYLVFDSIQLTLTVSISLFSVILVAGLFGTFIPLVLDKWKIDPALATGPFITTVNDVLGLFIYFMIARMLY